MELRKYQKEAIDALWSELFTNRTALCALPTAAGKTFIFQKLIEKSILLKPDIKIVIILNKVILLNQTIKRFVNAFGEKLVGVYCGSSDKYEIEKTITIATIQSVYDLKLESLNLIIIDEVHGVDQDNGRYIDFLNSHTKAKIVAFSATPYRSSGFIYGEGKLFKSVTYKKSVLEMINAGFLVRPKMKKVEHQLDTSKLRIVMGEYSKNDVSKLTSNLGKIHEQVTHALERTDDRKCIIWACASIQHCEDVCAEINKIEKAVCLHSKLSEKEKDLNTELFESGNVKHLVFVTIASEGWDHPPVDCIVLMRPIRSPVLYVQIVGRGLRTYPGKKDCLVLDFGKVVETLGPVDRPLVGKGRVKKSDKPIGMKFCPACLEYVESTEEICPSCEHDFFKEQRERDATKNLERKSFVGDILSKPQPHVVVEKTIDIIDVRISMFVSRANNKCLKIDYISEGIIRHTICQFFTWDKEWAQKKAQKTLIQLDCDLKSTLEEQAKCKPRKIPKSIVYVVEGGYEKVKRLNF